MPIFDYTCTTCEIKKEVFVKSFTEQVTCNNCDSKMIKQVCSPSFCLKGAGFFSPGSNPKSREGPHIPNEFKEMSDVDLNRSLGLPDDH